MIRPAHRALSRKNSKAAKSAAQITATAKIYNPKFSEKPFKGSRDDLQELIDKNKGRAGQPIISQDADEPSLREQTIWLGEDRSGKIAWAYNKPSGSLLEYNVILQDLSILNLPINVRKLLKKLL